MNENDLILIDFYGTTEEAKERITQPIQTLIQQRIDSFKITSLEKEENLDWTKEGF